MSTAPNTDPSPIYESLKEEHGDVVAEARRAAEATERTAAETLGDWHGPGPAD
jgi:hypothetical protein